MGWLHMAISVREGIPDGIEMWELLPILLRPITIQIGDLKQVFSGPTDSFTSKIAQRNAESIGTLYFMT